MFNPDGTFQREGTKHISPDRRQPSRRRSFPPTGHNRYLSGRIDFLSVSKMVSPAFLFLFSKLSCGVGNESEIKAKESEIGLEVQWEKKIQVFYLFQYFVT
jgi:hypothetical protein